MIGCRPTIRGLCLPIRVCPFGGDDCLDPPRRELNSCRKRIAGVLRPKSVNAEERHLIVRPAEDHISFVALARPMGDSGGRMTGSPGRCNCRVTKNTAAVHVGNRSAPGRASIISVGRKAQCQPSSRINTTATTASSTVSAGDNAPSTNSGKHRKLQRVSSQGHHPGQPLFAGSSANGRNRQTLPLF